MKIKALVGKCKTRSHKTKSAEVNRKKSPKSKSNVPEAAENEPQPDSQSIPMSPDTQKAKDKRRVTIHEPEPDQP